MGEDAPCIVGEDLFAHWYKRPRESQVCFEFAEVAVITEEEGTARVDRWKLPI